MIQVPLIVGGSKLTQMYMYGPMQTNGTGIFTYIITIHINHLCIQMYHTWMLNWYVWRAKLQDADFSQPSQGGRRAPF